MNKEQQELLDEAYESYVSTHENFEWTDDFCKKNLKDYGDQWDVFSKVEFINKCKTDTEFSEKWGLKIEEREMSLEERSIIAKSNHYEVSQNIKMFVRVDEDRTLHKNLDEINIPTKLITVTYNNKTIENYE